MKTMFTKDTYGFMLATVLTGTVLYAGCSGDDDWEESQRQSLAERRMTRGAENIPDPPKPKPNPVEEIDSTMVYEAVDQDVEINVNTLLTLTFHVTSSKGTMNCVNPNVSYKASGIENEYYSSIQASTTKIYTHNDKIMWDYKAELVLNTEYKQNPAKNYPTTVSGSYSIKLKKVKQEDKDHEKKN